ncbi:hypothetical protein PVK06_034504 [Gossypium arboreum]|uniref:Zinc finger PMZ-type domain-containing protein n=1 Tax=Gossypium arboreum TaxID=29729 RepID=A0ABR0NEB8_GOSAR|nr:hypothetical protein PVK06_034504 [Gossypium arboreum]
MVAFGIALTIDSSGHVWCNDVMKEIRRNVDRANTMYVVYHSSPNLILQVTEYVRPVQKMSGASYRVDLSKGTCNCGRFQALRFPYAHVIVACAKVRIEYMSYINDVYKLERMHNVWRAEFLSILDESMWPPMSSASFKLALNMNLCRILKGRPTSTRMCTNMDVHERGNQQRLYGSSKNPRHTKTTCFVLRDSLRFQRL